MYDQKNYGNDDKQPFYLHDHTVQTDVLTLKVLKVCADNELLCQKHSEIQ